MNRKTAYILILAVLALFSACGGQGGKKGNAEAPLKTRKFPDVTPPSMLQEQKEIVEYMSMHYWDGIAGVSEGYLCDSLHMSGIAIGDVEQALANYLYILDMMPLNEARKGIRDLAEKAEACESADTSSNVFETMKKLSDKYIFDPNSPLRNEDLYQTYASVLSKSAHLTDAEKDRYAFLAKTCSLNAVGTKAADFRFTDRFGRERTLYSIKTDLTLLFFSNPGCEACMEIINNLKNDKKVDAMIADGSLSVVNIYIDEDIQAWREYMPIYPENWYNGFDPDLVIRTDLLYSVRAIPSLYLLDSDKTVLFKDAVPEKIFQYFSQL